MYVCMHVASTTITMNSKNHHHISTYVASTTTAMNPETHHHYLIASNIILSGIPQLVTSNSANYHAQLVYVDMQLASEMTHLKESFSFSRKIVCST